MVTDSWLFLLIIWSRSRHERVDFFPQDLCYWTLCYLARFCVDIQVFWFVVWNVHSCVSVPVVPCLLLFFNSFGPNLVPQRMWLINTCLSCACHEPFMHEIKLSIFSYFSVNNPVYFQTLLPAHQIWQQSLTEQRRWLAMVMFSVPWLAQHAQNVLFKNVLSKISPMGEHAPRSP